MGPFAPGGNICYMTRELLCIKRILSRGKILFIPYDADDDGKNVKTMV
jgi:hypothetical protein